ncbi:UNVERIFIED_CONTAM: hypothetical protein K2H54_006844 [Gekko kuhli]
MTSGCTVCVRGFPCELPPERVVDKLTVHFQRARNGGGEIANIEFAPESPDCAMVTFEEAAVALRVLKTDKQLLTVGGESYPLRVSPSAPGLNPNQITSATKKARNFLFSFHLEGCLEEIPGKSQLEISGAPLIFLRVSMEIDYGRVPGGKEILQSLCKQYGDVVFKFRPQEMTCLAKGPFTELQAFSSELLRGFQSKQKSSCPPAERRRSAGKAGGGGRSLQGVRKTQAEGKPQKATGEGPPPRNPKEKHTEPPLEDFSLVMDSDVYLYMREFCQKEFSSILLQHQVGLVDVSGGGIATLYLQGAPQGPGALAPAHLALSRLSRQLEASLRKEEISQRDLGGAEGARGLLGELRRLCPRLLCHQDEERLSLIGDRVDVSQAKQYVQGFIAAREPARDVPQAASMAQVRGKSPTPVRHVPRKGSWPRRSSGKTGCQLATRFNTPDPSASRPPFPRLDAPSGELLPGDPFQAADPHPAEAGSHTLQGAPAPPAPLETQADSPATPLGGPREARRSLGSEHPAPFGAPSGSVGSLGLFGGPKVSDLGRPDSPVLPKPPVDKPSPVARSRAGPLPHPSWEESLPPLLQQDLSRGRAVGRGQEAGLPLPEQQPPLSCPRMMAAQRGGVSQGGPPAAQGTGPPGCLCECFGYSELAVEGPEDEALAELCRGLRACHDGVVVLRERHRLGLSYPPEAKQQVLEALRSFSARRLAVLTEQLLSQDAQQQGRTQEDAGRAEIQRPPPQQIGKGSTAGPVGHPPWHPLSLAGESLAASWVPRAPDAPQPTAEQNFPSSGKAWLSRKLARTPAAGEGCPGEPGTEA